eukprot:jgi/Phyca11/550791/estExt2_Genewise1Plus.C_PHYCAscaffold_380328
MTPTSNNGQRSKYDMASLLGGNTSYPVQTVGKQLPKLSLVLQQRNGDISTPAPGLSTQSMNHDIRPSKTPIEQETTCSKRTKRLASECDEEKDSTMPASAVKRCRGKWRKPTYLVRKEEKSELLEHIKELENQISFLQNRSNIVAWQEKDRKQIETEIKNNALRNSNAQFVDEAGDFCSIRFDITPLEGLETVKEAFDFIKFHIKHMDTKPMNSKYTCTSELGDDNNVMHRRLIISEVENVAAETNFVLFSEQGPSMRRHDVCGEAEKSCDQGVMVMNFVDEDDLYPYRPQNCVRLDISGVMTLKSHRKVVKSPKGGEKEVPEVVLTRWMLQKLRRTDLPVPEHVLQTMRDRINDPGNAILRALKDARAPVDLEAKDIKVLSV